MHIEAMSLALPPVARHPNRLPFRGVLTVVGAPSDRPPAGARGHRVRITRQAAERALPSLLGMAVDWTPALDQHDARRKVGIITEADVVQFPVLGMAEESASLKGHDFSRAIQALIREAASAAEVSQPTAILARTDNRQPVTGNWLTVAGYLYAKDFPDLIRELRANSRALGMSYEISDARVEDVRAAVWTLTEVTFTGAAILRRDKAAYEGTWVELDESAVVSRQSAGSESLVARL